MIFRALTFLLEERVQESAREGVRACMGKSEERARASRDQCSQILHFT